MPSNGSSTHLAKNREKWHSEKENEVAKNIEYSKERKNANESTKAEVMCALTHTRQPCAN